MNRVLPCLSEGESRKRGSGVGKTEHCNACVDHFQRKCSISLCRCFFMSLTKLIIGHKDKSLRAKRCRDVVLQCLNCRCWAPSPKALSMARGRWSTKCAGASQ